MDKNKAWKNFKETGEIEDYLEFCKCKKMEEVELGKKSESEWDNNCGK